MNLKKLVNFTDNPCVRMQLFFILFMIIGNSSYGSEVLLCTGVPSKYRLNEEAEFNLDFWKGCAYDFASNTVTGFLDTVLSEEFIERLPDEVRDVFSFNNFTSTKSLQSLSCPDDLRDGLRGDVKKLLQNDNEDILSLQFHLTTLKLAQKAIGNNSRTLENYIKQNEKALGKAPINKEMQELYQKYYLAEDLSEIEAMNNVDQVEYRRGSKRIYNKKLSALILNNMHRGDKSLNMNDAAIARLTDYISEDALNQHGRYSLQHNLTNMSNIIAMYAGYIDPSKKKTPEEMADLIRQLEQKLKEKMDAVKDQFIHQYNHCVEDGLSSCAPQIKSAIDEEFTSGLEDILSELNKGEAKAFLEKTQFGSINYAGNKLPLDFNLQNILNKPSRTILSRSPARDKVDETKRNEIKSKTQDILKATGNRVRERLKAYRSKSGLGGAGLSLVNGEAIITDQNKYMEAYYKAMVEEIENSPEVAELYRTHIGQSSLGRSKGVRNRVWSGIASNDGFAEFKESLKEKLSIGFDKLKETKREIEKKNPGIFDLDCYDGTKLVGEACGFSGTGLGYTAGEFLLPSANAPTPAQHIAKSFIYGFGRAAKEQGIDTAKAFAKQFIMRTIANNIFIDEHDNSKNVEDFFTLLEKSNILDQEPIKSIMTVFKSLENLEDLSEFPETLKNSADKLVDIVTAMNQLRSSTPVASQFISSVENMNKYLETIQGFAEIKHKTVLRNY